jgi:gluconolactonase
MTVTTDGRIAAHRAGAYDFSPEGTLLSTIPTPDPPANVEFGRSDCKTLYIMAGKHQYRIRTTLTGFHVWPTRR